METMEIKKTGLDYSNQAIKISLEIAIKKIKQTISDKKFVLEGDLDLLKNIDLDNATRTSKKKLAKKIDYCIKSDSRRKMNAMLSFIYKSFLKNKKIIINRSVEQQKIDKARKEYKEQFKLVEELRNNFKGFKKTFRENGGIYEA